MSAEREASEQKLPAVSGSSGRLVVERPRETEAEQDWAGQAFADESLDYEEAMLEFVAASRTQSEATETNAPAKIEPEASLKAQKRVLRQVETDLRAERRVERQQRQQEDAAWRVLKQQRREQKVGAAERISAQRKAQDATWQAVREQRRETQQQRQQEDEVWRAKRTRLREQLEQLPIVTAWIAILVIVDNCTRQCLSLPLFVAGPKVTAEMVVEALRMLLPPELKFLITDRGTHFTASVFQELMRTEEFIHVLIARHRPQSNGIAERFVRTLKEWLLDKTWQDDQELAALLAQFRAEFNDRPHQGLATPGLSPNEFAKRIWLM